MWRVQVLQLQQSDFYIKQYYMLLENIPKTTKWNSFWIFHGEENKQNLFLIQTPVIFFILQQWLRKLRLPLVEGLNSLHWKV